MSPNQNVMNPISEFFVIFSKKNGEFQTQMMSPGLT